MAGRIFITVAETSADQHAAQLARALYAMDPSLVIEGHGGEHMAAAGVRIHHNTTQRAAMGLAAAGRAREVWRLLKWTRAYQQAHRPDLHICCDSWSMNRHFAQLAKSQGVAVLYYIAPQAWASREGRVKKLREIVDRVACILPFEEEFFRRHGVPATYVGHPLFDELGADRPRGVVREIEDGRPIVGILPGSRSSVVRGNFPRLLEVADRIRQVYPQAIFKIPTTATTHELVGELARRHGADGGADGLVIEQDAFNKIVPGCDLCLTVSGTAALQVAAFGVPMMVVYYGNRILWHLVARWVVKTRTYSLVNLLSDEPGPIVPEYIPWYGSTEPVARAAVRFLQRAGDRRVQQRNLLAMLKKIDRPGASENTAKLAWELMGRSPVEG